MHKAVLEAMRQKCSPLHNPCVDCANRGICLPGNLSKEKQQRFCDAFRPTRIYRRGDTIFRTGDPFHSLFAVRSGSVKSQQPTAERIIDIIGFHFDGDLFGLDAVGSKKHPSESVAAKPTILCELPYENLVALCAEIPEVQDWLMQRMGERLKTQQVVFSWTARKQPDIRVMCFFLDLRGRMILRERPDGGFLTLPVHKIDIARYLRMAPETLSRTLAVLRSRNWLEISDGRFRLPDSEMVEELMGK